MSKTNTMITVNYSSIKKEKNKLSNEVIIILIKRYCVAQRSTWGKWLGKLDLEAIQPEVRIKITAVDWFYLSDRLTPPPNTARVGSTIATGQGSRTSGVQSQ